MRKVSGGCSTHDALYICAYTIHRVRVTRVTMAIKHSYHAHQVSSRGAAHSTDSLRVDPILCGVITDTANCSLNIL